MSKNVLEIIESEHDISKIILKNGLQVWPLFRQKIYFKILKKTLNYSSKSRTRNKGFLFVNLFYGWINLFKLKSYKYIAFVNTNKRILLDGKYFDVYFDAWADKLGQDKTLFVEFASQKHYARRKVHSKNVVSDLPFIVFSSIFSLFIFPELENLIILEEIAKNHNIKINFKRELKKKLGELYFYKFLFKISKIKTVFVLSSFTKVSIVMAAKQLNIKVYEAQHGFIGESHPFYSAKIRFEESYPDFLFSFGNYEINNNNSIIFKPYQIIPIGGLQLESIKQTPPPKPLIVLKSKYSKIFCLTMQAIKEKELLQSIQKYANEHQDQLFIICPKDKSINYDNYTAVKNITILPEYSIYDVLKISDFNITIFSTTAIEGEALGAKTIFFNADNFSKKYFKIEKMNATVISEGEYLNENHLSRFEDKIEQYCVNHYFKNVQNTTLEI